MLKEIPVRRIQLPLLQFSLLFSFIVKKVIFKNCNFSLFCLIRLLSLIIYLAFLVKITA